MKNLYKITLLVFVSILCSFMFTSCYDDYVYDYIPMVYFSSQQPLRTVIADRDMSIKVGVVIAGKREVDTNDWATFDVNETLLENTSLTLLPPSYYTLSDETTMKVRDKAVAIADVDISFTDAFYADPLSTSLHYALPLEITGSSCDSIVSSKSTTIVAVKYESTYAGTYWVQGSVETLDENGNVVSTDSYNNNDLSTNITRTLSTINRTKLERKGLANFPTSTLNQKLIVTFNGTDLTLSSADDGVEVLDGTGTYDPDAKTLSLDYKFVVDGVTYHSVETLTLRQDIVKDLRYEEWS